MDKVHDRVGSEFPQPTTQTWLGIDPGLNGGIASIDSEGDARAVKMPTTERDILDAINELRGEKTLCVVEKVASSP